MEDLDKHVEDIYRALDGRVDRETIARELRNWLVNFRIPIAEAKRSIVSKLGGDPTKLVGNVRKISELTPGLARVDLRAKVISINSREYEIDGTIKKMHYGIIGDETGTIQFTAWRLDIELRKGDCIEIKNAYTREWQGTPQLVIGVNTRISLLPPDSVSVKMNIVPRKIVELHPRMGLVEVVGKILEVSEKEVMVEGVPRKVFEGLIGDDTGEIPFSAWDVKVNPGEVLRISGAYVRSFRGMPQLVFDPRATISRERIDIEVREIPVSLESLEGKGGFNVLVEGVIIDVKKGSGLIYRCPECGRVLTSTFCPEHGKVTPKPDMRIKAILDDGTGAAMCIFNSEQTERILGMDINGALQTIQENMGNPAVIRELIEDKLIAMPMRVRGNAISKEKYGLTLLVKSFEFLDIDDVAEKAETMLEDLGW